MFCQHTSEVVRFDFVKISEIVRLDILPVCKGCIACTVVESIIL